MSDSEKIEKIKALLEDWVHNTERWGDDYMEDIYEIVIGGDRE